MISNFRGDEEGKEDEEVEDARRKEADELVVEDEDLDMVGTNVMMMKVRKGEEQR